MKLIHILNEINFSGAEVMLNLAAPIFKENGFDLHALSTGNNRGDYAEILEKAGYKIHHIPFRKHPIYFWQLYKELRKDKFDIVHIHPERAFVWHALIGKIAGSKVVVRTVHSIFNFKGSLRIKKYFVRWFSRSILKVKFHTISDSVAQVEKENFNNPTKKIYNWIDENKFYPISSLAEKIELRKKLAIGEDKFIIVSVGACSKVKRHYAIIEAVKTILKKAPNVIYLHLGSGELLTEEKNLANRLSIEDKIIFAGQKENVRDYLAASDVFVMVSEYEGLSIASLEALFCGLPLIVYDTYGLRDVIEDGYNGFKIRNPSELPEAVIKIYNSFQLQKEFSQNAIKFAKEKFSMRKSINELMQFYKVDVNDRR